MTKISAIAYEKKGYVVVEMYGGSGHVEATITTPYGPKEFVYELTVAEAEKRGLIVEHFAMDSKP